MQMLIFYIIHFLLFLLQTNIAAKSVHNDKAVLSVSNNLIYRINHECYCLLNSYEYYHTIYDNAFFNDIRLLISKHKNLLIIFTPILFPIYEVEHFPQEKEDVVILFDKSKSNKVISLILTHSTTSIDFLDNYWRKYSECGLIDSIYLALESYLIQHSNNQHNHNITKIYLCKDNNKNTNTLNENRSLENILFIDNFKYSYQNNMPIKYFRNNDFTDNIRNNYNKSFYFQVPVHNVYDVIDYFPLTDKCIFHEKIKSLMKQEIYYVSKNYSIDVQFTNTSISKVFNYIRESSSYITLYQHKIKISSFLNILQGFLYLIILILLSFTMYCGGLLEHKLNFIRYFLLFKMNTNYSEKKHHK